MILRLGIAGAIAILTLLSYFQFPGHTYLSQDSQIYVPILEHLRDPAVLSRDILVERPHVAFTIYDEVALGLRRVTGLNFQRVLAGEQLLYRGLGLWGIYLIAVAALRDRGLALSVTAMLALGAEVPGPAVLVMEYEPTPRAFAIPLLFLAVGLIATGRTTWGCVAAGVAFLFHPPSAYPFWLVYLATMARRRRGLAIFLAGAAVLSMASYFQAGVKESQEFFSRLAPELEALQRMRAPYNWVSLWWLQQIGQYCFLAAIGAAALWRLRAELGAELRIFLVGLPLVGLASVPASYLLLERLKWALIPQVQPARALLFVVAVAVLAAALAGCQAARRGRWIEAFGWFAIVYLVPMHDRIDAVPKALHVSVALALTLLACAGSRWRGATAVAALAPFFAIPLLAHAVNYPVLESSELRALSAWARDSTPRDAVFIFPGPPKNLEPGIFRAEALRAVYVDWKGGGQVNYLKDFSGIWWTRYRKALLHPFAEEDLERLEALGIDYVVLPSTRAIDRAEAYGNSRYRVYRAR